MIELGPSLRTQAAPCSLNRPTGTHRRVRTVRSDLTPVIRLAHQNGATVNDVILSAITGALHLLLAERGEHMPAFVVSIPVSSRPQVGHGELGNQSGVVPVLLPATGTFPARLASTARSPGPPRVINAGHPPRCWSLVPCPRHDGDLSALHRPPAVDPHVRQQSQGDRHRRTLLGYPITGIIPLAVATGNVTVAFTALSYAGSLVITISADPDTCPDLDRLQQELQRQLNLGLESLLS